ncbi:hypothetical protein Hypma_007305 [Hypsizygus marmoreus]|uniref:Uncharacterized protein n=1 Tax=Hypsizygus marmoreus TaxID=39966 RepID=A0A369K6L8_HYPMA|nr:hypothetical protein Hypma_007305 [Hypsizygus marmoreus]
MEETHLGRGTMDSTYKRVEWTPESSGYPTNTPAHSPYFLSSHPHQQWTLSPRSPPTFPSTPHPPLTRRRAAPATPPTASSSPRKMSPPTKRPVAPEIPPTVLLLEMLAQPVQYAPSDTHNTILRPC